MVARRRSGVTGSISIKGTEEGLVVGIGTGEWSTVINEVADLLRQKAPFFDGARAILNLGSRELDLEDLEHVQELLSVHRIEMCAVRTNNARTAAVAASMGIATATECKHEQTHETQHQTGLEPEEGLFLKRTIHSGQTVECLGHVTVLGDLNPGGQVLAGGDIVIWGKLRGTVHAGAIGDDGATVCALVLAPTQLRIGSHIARSPEEEAREPGVPEIARVQDGGIVVEPWRAIKS